jgi:predicted peroxiredoxin
MRLGVIVYTNDPETMQNALEFANYSQLKKDIVRVYLLGKGVEYQVHGKMEGYSTQPFKTIEHMKKFIDNGGEILASGKCLEFRELGVPELCKISSIDDLYSIVTESDRVVTF